MPVRCLCLACLCLGLLGVEWSGARLVACLLGEDKQSEATIPFLSLPARLLVLLLGAVASAACSYCE